MDGVTDRMEEARERFNRALAVDRDGNLPLALDEYNEIIREFGGFREAYINLGSVYARMDRLDEAMESYARALEYGEDHIVHFNIGSLHYKRGEYKNAVISLARSRGINASFALSSLLMGLSYSKMKDRKAAESCFREVIAVWPGNLIALTALSILYYQSGRYQASLGMADRILVLDTGNIGIRKLRARALDRLNRYGDYAAEIKVIKGESEDFRIFDDFIRRIPLDVYSDRYGTLDEKMELLREKTRDASEVSSLVSLSLCHLLKGDTDLAVDFLLEAKKRSVN